MTGAETGVTYFENAGRGHELRIACGQALEAAKGKEMQSPFRTSEGASPADSLTLAQRN